MLELIETISLMTSGDYKNRFKAEYQQLKIRRDKLAQMLTKCRLGELEFEPTCPLKLLDEQLAIMNEYIVVLEKRAVYEGIDLGEES